MRTNGAYLLWKYAIPTVYLSKYALNDISPVSSTLPNTAPYLFMTILRSQTLHLTAERLWFHLGQHQGMLASTIVVEEARLYSFRILLPVKKFGLADDDIQMPIPMLSDRQFVVSKSGLTAEQERMQRELFWYREALFKYVRGRWKEVRRLRM